MKKLIGTILVALLCAAGSFADSYTYVSAVLTGATQVITSDDIPVAGELDRVILWNTDPKGTSVVVIANYAGTSVADVLFTGLVNNASAAPIVVKTRRVGTDSAGTALTFGYTSTLPALTNMSQILTVPYERPWLGGNTKIRIVDQTTTACTNYLNAQFIFRRP